MAKLKGHKLALVVGLFLSAVHVIWALMIAIMRGVLQNWLNWIFDVHFLVPYWTLTQFNFLGALQLAIFTFAIGYGATWLFVWLWNLLKVRK